MATGRRTVVVLVAAVGAAAFLLVSASSSAPSAAGTLNLRATLATSSPSATCPPEAPPGADCHPRTGNGSVSGLGTVVAKYTWLFGMGDCPTTLVKPLATTGRIVVANKGEIDFGLSDGARCVEQEPVRNEPQDFTVTGGTGAYQGASGRGAVERSLSGGHGVERWAGALTVPGPGVRHHAAERSPARCRNVRAERRKRVRVTYKVAASDAVDKQVAVVCLPWSGSWFPIGRTSVTCQARDSSGNTGRARFAVTVKR